MNVELFVVYQCLCLWNVENVDLDRKILYTNFFSSDFFNYFLIDKKLFSDTLFVSPKADVTCAVNFKNACPTCFL